jgi:hypothetical protein
MEIKYSSEMCLSSHKVTWWHSRDDRSSTNHRHKNLKQFKQPTTWFLRDCGHQFFGALLYTRSGGHRVLKNYFTYTGNHVRFGTSVRFNTDSFGKCSCSWRNVLRRSKEILKLFRCLLSQYKKQLLREAIPMLNSLRMQTSGAMIIKLRTRWKWVISFTPRQAFQREKDPKWAYPFTSKLNGSHCRSGRGGEKKNCCPFRESNPVKSARCRSLYWLSYIGSFIIKLKHSRSVSSQSLSSLKYTDSPFWIAFRSYFLQPSTTLIELPRSSLD